MARSRHHVNDVRAIDELPLCFRPTFAFRYFNVVQSEAFEQAYEGDSNMVKVTPAVQIWMSPYDEGTISA